MNEKREIKKNLNFGANYGVTRAELVMSGTIPPPPALVVTEHDISRIMFGGSKLLMHPKGRVICGNIRYGHVYIYVEEPQDAAVPVERVILGYRDGQRITMKNPKYLCSVFEATDHAHIYEDLG